MIVLGCLTNFSGWWESPSIFWYLCSTAAQSAAGFEALLGAFAIFRFQANDTWVGQVYTEALSWLRKQPAQNFPKGTSPSRGDIKQELQNMRDGIISPANAKEAGEWWETLDKAEAFPRVMGEFVSKPMVAWGVVFLTALTSLALPKWGNSWTFLGVVIIAIVIAISAYALQTTSRFIQICLDTQKVESVKK